MNPKKVLSVLVLFVLIAGSIHAFDGQRKGFVVGLGTGFAPLIKGVSLESDQDSDTRIGYSSGLVIGYAWNNRNMVLLQVSQGLYEETLDVYYSGRVVYRDNIQFYQGFAGFVFRRYFSPEARSPYVTAGVGSEQWLPEDHLDEQDGTGFLIGGGYEFAKHFQLEGSYSFGDVGGAGRRSEILINLFFVLY